MGRGQVDMNTKINAITVNQVILKNSLHDGMATLEQTVRIFLEAYDVQVWGDLIGLDLGNKPQWDSYYYDYCHHGEPSHISKICGSLFIQTYHWLQETQP